MVEMLENPASISNEDKRLDEIESYHSVSDIVDSVALTVGLSVINNLPLFALPYSNFIVNVIATDMVC